MKIINFIKKLIKLTMCNYFSIKIISNKKNIFKNTSSPEKEVIKVLYESKGIIHIGAHRGSERYIYDWLGKKVLWVEANSDIFQDLLINISEFKYQTAYQAVLHSSYGKKINFYLSSNDAASSSIYDFSKQYKEKKIHFENKVRNISMKNEIELTTNTLDNLFLKIDENINDYDHLVIDVQGAELEVLKGSNKMLDVCKTIFVEVSTEKFYQNGSNWTEIKKFLNTKNFIQLREPLKNHDDIIFIKK